jgi:ketol-acid reductoisomerase
MLHHSTTSQYGTLSRGPRFVSEEFRAKAKEILTRDIKGGDFVKEWSDEQAGGSQRLKELMAKALEHPMSKAEHSIIPLIQAAQATEE